MSIPHKNNLDELKRAFLRKIRKRIGTQKGEENIKLSERVLFHQFWLWEYQRRNSTYRQAYDRFIQELSKSGFQYWELSFIPEATISESSWNLFQCMITEKDNFYKEFSREPKDYNEGVASGDLLKSVLSEDFAFPADSIKSIKLKTKIDDFQWPYLKVRLDLEEDPGIVLNEISYLHSEYRLKKELYTIWHPEKCKKLNVLSQKVGETKDVLLKSQAGLKQGRLHVLPRTVGLWLWDRWDKKRKISKYGIVQEFFYEVTQCKDGQFFSNETGNPLIFSNEEIKDAYIEVNHLRRILSKTISCIKEVKVLPIK